MPLNVTTPQTRVLVQSMGGPAGPTGAAGQSTVQRVAAQAIAAGRAVRTTGASQEMTPALASLRTLPFDGLCLGDIQSGAVGNFHVAGPVPANVLQLGAGVACAVGVTATGVPVRATDPLCVSAPNYVGVCDVSGNVTVGPVRKSEFNVLDFGAVGDDSTDNGEAFRAAIASLDDALGGTIYVPNGAYRIGSDLGAFPSNTRMRGDVFGANAKQGSVLKFTSSDPISGIYPCRQVDANADHPIWIENLWVMNINADNDEGAGLEYMGGGNFFFINCRTSGWKYHIVLDGCDNGHVLRHHFDYNGLGVITGLTTSLWTVNGSDRGHGFTVPDATNHIIVDECFFNGTTRMVRATGGVSQHFHNCIGNIGDDGAIVIENIQSSSFRDWYLEGNLNITPALTEVIQITGSYSLEFGNIFCAVGSGLVGVPWIRVLSTSRSCSINDCVVSCGSITEGSIAGAGNCVDWTFGSNNILNNHGTLFTDVDTGPGTMRMPGCSTFDAYNRRLGVNTSIPSAIIDAAGLDSTGYRLLNMRTLYGTAALAIDVGGTQSESNTLSRTCFEVGGSGAGVAGIRDQITDTILVANTGATAISAALDIPTNAMLLAEVTIVGRHVTDATKNCGFKKVMQVYRDTVNCTIQNETDVGTPYAWNTDAFTAPTVSVAANTVQVTLTAQAAYDTVWMTRTEVQIARY